MYDMWPASGSAIESRVQFVGQVGISIGIASSVITLVLRLVEASAKSQLKERRGNLLVPRREYLRYLLVKDGRRIRFTVSSGIRRCHTASVSLVLIEFFCQVGRNFEPMDTLNWTLWRLSCNPTPLRLSLLYSRVLSYCFYKLRD